MCCLVVLSLLYSCILGAEEREIIYRELLQYDGDGPSVGIGM